MKKKRKVLIFVLITKMRMPSQLERKLENDTLKLEFEGKLTSIPEVGPFYVDTYRDFIPMDVQEPTPKRVGEYTVLRIATEDGVKEVRYHGIILPDSIGHQVQVFKSVVKIQIKDVELDRWYK